MSTRTMSSAAPLLKGGVQAALVNNLIYNPGQKAVHYNLMALEWGNQPYVTGELSAVGNVMRGGNCRRGPACRS